MKTIGGNFPRKNGVGQDTREYHEKNVLAMFIHLASEGTSLLTEIGV